MCGIAGFFDANAAFQSNKEYYETLLRKMGRTLKHRGPDGFGIILTDKCGLSHTRLAIIDPAGGAQPMTKTYARKIDKYRTIF